MVPKSDNSIELALLEAIKAKDKEKVQTIIDTNPGLNLDCCDEDEFSPVQHACHFGEIELVKLLLDNGAQINYTPRKDRYTPLMLAALANKVDVVMLLLERGADKKALNSVNRTASDMAAFVGLGRVATLINCYLPYEDTIEPYTKCLELEDKPRLNSNGLAIKLHQWILQPTVHPIKLIYYLSENPDLMRHGESCIFVLNKLSSKYLKPQCYNEILSLKFHYLAELFRNCKTLYEKSDVFRKSNEFIDKDFEIIVMKYLRRLNTRRQPTENSQVQKPILNDLILRCAFSYAHNTATHQSMKFALTKLQANNDNFDAVLFMAQTLGGVGAMSLSSSNEDCEVCREGGNNKKCGSCKTVYYCGPICQKVDWSRHKKDCIRPTT